MVGTTGQQNGGRCIAMWSGPRNLSTAMLRAWENRPDTQVVDEPLYAHYLAHTGIRHPMAAEIIAQGETDWQRVLEQITTRPAHGIFYQKHITTHLLPHIPLDFVPALTHVFLIRDPAAVVRSYARKREQVDATDLGYDRQHQLFEQVCEHLGEAPPVIDSARFLQNPRGQLETLCHRLDIAFDERMLEWPAGERASDGIWHRHWYDAVKRSTGFAAAPAGEAAAEAPLPDTATRIAAACQPAYDALLRFAM